MQLQTILVLFTLNGIVRGLVANLTPFLFSIGTVLMALEPNIDLQPFELPIKKSSEKSEDSKEKEIKDKKKKSAEDEFIPIPLTPEEEKEWKKANDQFDRENEEIENTIKNWNDVWVE